MLGDFFDLTFGAMLLSVFKVFIAAYPIWLPIILVVAFWILWVDYVRNKFFVSQEYSLLEIRVPRDVTKGPQAMEMVLAAMHQTGGEGTWYHRYIRGQTKPWYSLELVSIEGKVHFYIWTRSFWKNLIETELYAQYPGIEVIEVPDYTKNVQFDPEKMGVWGMEYKLSRKSKNDEGLPLMLHSSVYPIRTYYEFGLEKASEKEEFKSDPLNYILEYLGSLGPGEQMWIQIMIRAHRKEMPHGSFTEISDWAKAASKEIKTYLKTEGMFQPTKEGEEPNLFSLSPAQTDLVKGIENNVKKPGFDTGIRGIYIAEKSKFRPVNAPVLIGLFRPFQSVISNGIVLNADVQMPYFKGYPWEDPKQKLQNEVREFLIEASKRRGFFYPPYNSSKPFILNTEALATLFHIPGSVNQTPTIDRIASKRAEAPANLPI